MQMHEDEDHDPCDECHDARSQTDGDCSPYKLHTNAMGIEPDTTLDQTMARLGVSSCGADRLLHYHHRRASRNHFARRSRGAACARSVGLL